jgi:hypothetical protein
LIEALDRPSVSNSPTKTPDLLSSKLPRAAATHPSHNTVRVHKKSALRVAISKLA